MLRRKVIEREDGTPYLIRIYLLKTPWFQICLHKILLSDDDCLHDHPWNFISIILRGGYTERTFWRDRKMGKYERQFYELTHQPDDIRNQWYGPGSILYRPALWRHALRLPPGKTALTLVIMFKRKREWGFWNSKGWVPWFNYQSKQKCD